MQLLYLPKWSKKNRAGLFPVVLRITIHGRRATHATGLQTTRAGWNQAKEGFRGSDSTAAKYNDVLLDLKGTAHANKLDLQRAHTQHGGPPVTAQLVAASLRPAAPAEAVCCIARAAAQAADPAMPGSVSTRATRTRAVALLLAWHGAGPLPAEALSRQRRQRFADWLTHPDGAGLSVDSARTYAGALSALWRRAELGLCAPGGGAFTGVRWRGADATAVRLTLSREQLAVLREAPLPEWEDAARRLYLACFHLHGSRIGVVLRLRWQDVRGGRVHYQADKGGAAKAVKLTPALAALLAAPGESEALVFPWLEPAHFQVDATERHRQLVAARNNVTYYLRKACARLGLPAGLHPHTARHTMALLSAEAGGLRAAQGVLGHKRLSTTERYIRAMFPAEVDAAADDVYDSL